MNKLPNDVIKNIRGYGSDVYEPTPTAELIKTLRFDHKDASEDNGLYLPHRLEVTATDGHFISPSYWIRNMRSQIRKQRLRSSPTLPSSSC